MASTCNDAAVALLEQCIAGIEWDPSLVRQLAAPDCSDALFRTLIEGLADRFDARLCDAYAIIFSQILEASLPDFTASQTYARHQRVRLPRVCSVEPRRVVVLSRVTLGADIAVTSVVLDAMLRRFPRADIYFAGSTKAFELFAGCSRLQHLDIAYPRTGSISDRIEAWRSLASRLDDPGTIVVDPDSRLTQLGLLPVCDESRYFFFESRSFGGNGFDNLTTLTQRWIAATFGVPASRNFIHPAAPHEPVAPFTVTVSLGTADNPCKQLPEPFEAELVRLLCSRFAHVVVDRGFGHAENARVERAVAGTPAYTFAGSFARFATRIAGATCYVGYDSAGQHAAAASGTPLLTLFKGFASDRMFTRWQPAGPGPKQILKIGDAIGFDRVSAALDRLLEARVRKL